MHMGNDHECNEPVTYVTRSTSATVHSLQCVCSQLHVTCHLLMSHAWLNSILLGIMVIEQQEPCSDQCHTLKTPVSMATSGTWSIGDLD